MDKAIWTPKAASQSQMAAFMTFAQEQKGQYFESYQDLHTWSIKHPDSFWATLCEFFNLCFDTPPHLILNAYRDLTEARWFSGATFNFAEQLLRGQKDQPALISLSEHQERQVLSYEQLAQEVAQCAAGLKAHGVMQGDRVAAVMPNTAQTIIAMLATASLGAIWASTSPDFGAQAILDRLEQIEPKVLFISDGYQYQGKIYKNDEKIKELHSHLSSLKALILCPFIQESQKIPLLNKTLYWKDFIKPALRCDFVSLPFDHPLYLLFSSGTTGKPKCILHGAGGTLIQHLKELGLHTNLGPQDNLCFYTTCGWMMWNWMVSALALGSTLTLYEGSPVYPNKLRLFELIEQEGVTVFGTSAKYLATLEKAGLSPKKDFALSSLKCILSTGSPLAPHSYDYVYQEIKKELQLSSISGGTDIISCFALGNPILPVYRGELQCIGLGMDVAIFNEAGEALSQTKGELVCLRPFPSMPLGFWNDPDKSAYHRAYFEHFPGVWAHGDFAELTVHQGLIIYGRSDAVLNPGGVRIGTAEIYRQVEKIDAILESIVIGQDWDNDVRIVLFVKLKEGFHLDEALIQRIKGCIRDNASPRHVPAKILEVADIPRTMNGKIVELAVRQVVHHQPVNNLQALANPEALAYFRDRPELQ